MPLVQLVTSAPMAVYSQQVVAVANAMRTHLGKSLSAIRTVVETDASIDTPALTVRGLYQPDTAALHAFAEAVQAETGLVFSADNYVGYEPDYWFQGSLPILRAKDGEQELVHGRFPVNEAQQISVAVPTIVVEATAAIDARTSQAMASIAADIVLDHGLDNDPPTHIKTLVRGNAYAAQITLYLLDVATRRMADEALQSLQKTLSRHASEALEARVVRLSSSQCYTGTASAV